MPRDPRISPIIKCALAVACIALGACEAKERKLQCADPHKTSECGRLLSACQSETAASNGNSKSASQLMTACLRRSYESRCNSTCQVAE